jgi:hypothetical protein
MGPMATATATALDITDIMGRDMHTTDPATIGRATITDGKQEKPEPTPGFLIPVCGTSFRGGGAAMPVMSDASPTASHD